MVNTLFEKFSWLSPDFTVHQDIGKKTVRIKGIAMRGNAVSRNNRRYVNEELKRAARTFIDMPITINHDPQKEVGKVTWMEYDDDENMEYIGEVWKQPYVDLIRSHSTEVKGVSIEADYLHNVCPDCGTKFYSERDFSDHRRMEGKPVNAVEPHGMRGKALSLVLSPEVPGFAGTTIQIAETIQQWKGLEELFSVLVTTAEEKEKMTKETVKNDVPYKVKPNLETKETTVAPAIQEPPAPPTIVAAPIQETQKLMEKVTLKEQKSRSFEQCMADGGSEEECALECKETRIKNENMKALETAVNSLIGWNERIETMQHTIENRLTSVASDIVSATNKWNSEVAKLTEAITAIPKDDLGWKEIKPYDDTQLKEAISKIPVYDDKPLREAIAAIKIPEAYNDAALREMIMNQRKEFETVLAVADKNIVETRKSLEEQLKAKDKEIAEMKKSLAETEEKKLAESVSLTNRVDNLEDKIKPGFKGVAKGVETKEAVTVNNFTPYGK